MIIKKITIGIFILFITFSCVTKKKQTSKIDWIDFEWARDSVAGVFYEKSGINIPFTIEGVPHKFHCQFDLGAVKTMLYGNSIAPYLKTYPLLNEKIDTLKKTFTIENKRLGIFKNVNFKLGKVDFHKKDIVYFEGFGDTLTVDSVATKTVKHIGTIGPDLFQNKFLIIDFPNQKMAVLDSLNQYYKKYTKFVKSKIKQGRIKIPVSVNEKTYDFMFDTGSSIFPFLVSYKDWGKFGNINSKIDTLKVTSWGTSLNVYGIAISSKIKIANTDLNTQNKRVFTDKNEFDFESFNKQEKIMGIMGNALFLDKTIIIDYKNNRFGIVSEFN